MTAVIADLYRSLQELCFPAVCLICQRSVPAFSEIHLCPGCREKMSLIAPPLCLCCGVEFAAGGESHLCGRCLAQPPGFTRARAIFRYDEASAALVHGFKYGGRTVARQTFRALAALALPLADLEPPDLIVPVPLHPKRLKERGFNQALVLARFLFPEQRRLICPNTLIRNRWTEPQVALSGQQRRRNLGGAFSLRRPDRVAGRRVLLVDDVFTTGTTLNECARVLKQHGAARVEALTLARVGY